MNKKTKDKCKYKQGNYCKLYGEDDIESGCIGERICGESQKEG